MSNEVMLAVGFREYGVCVIVNDTKTALNTFLNDTKVSSFQDFMKRCVTLGLRHSIYGVSVMNAPTIGAYKKIDFTDRFKFSMNGKCYSTLNELKTELCPLTLTVGKFYRFIYNGGTRAGQKRAIKVMELKSYYAVAQDLDTGDTKNYLFSKMQNVEEIN